MARVVEMTVLTASAAAIAIASGLSHARVTVLANVDMKGTCRQINTMLYGF
jgi:hypothetical protein